MKYCQCEDISHVADNHCQNAATIAVSPSWTICDACEATMDIGPAILAVTERGPYAGQMWHAPTRA